MMRSLFRSLNRRFRLSKVRFSYRIRSLEDLRYRNNRVSLTAQLNNVVLEGSVRVADFVRFSGDVRVGKYSTLDRGCIVHGGEVRIGRYTQIGPNVGIYALNHATSTVTIYNNAYLFEGRLKGLGESSFAHIGHDVWIGYGAVILPGVTVGHGAIIGAGSVVTRDVPAYTVAVGNPARVIKSRFSESITELLLEWAWWQYDPPALAAYEDLFTINLTENPEAAYEALAARLKSNRASTFSSSSNG